MSRRKCSLCGGEVSNHICTFCGFDNSINQREEEYYNYGRRKQSEGNYDRNKARPPRLLEKPPGRFKKAVGHPSPGRHMASAYGAQKRKKSLKGRGIFIGIASALICLLSVASQIASNFHEEQEADIWISEGESEFYEDDFGWQEDVYTDVYEDDWYDDYAGTDSYDEIREIPETGSEYETVIGSGNYVVGVHIPEGVYKAEVLAGFGFVTASHDEFGIYESTYFGTETESGQVEEKEDLHLYNGENVKVNTQVLVRLTTQNAQPLEQKIRENPLTEPVALAPGNYVAGEEALPEGIFDLLPDESDSEGFTAVTFIYPNGFQEYCGVFDAEHGVKAEDYLDVGAKNMVVPAGTEVEVEYGNVIFAPSENYFEADYEQYLE